MTVMPRTYRRLLAGFFFLMLVFTLISRSYDAWTVPKVTTAKGTRKSIQQKLNGNGTIGSGTSRFADIYPGCRVESVQAVQGAFVKTGDELFRYQMSSLKEKEEELRQELDKLFIDLEKEQISSEVYPNVTQEELALQEVAAAAIELEEGKAAYDQAYADYHANKEELEREYQRKSNLTEEELWNQNQQQYIASRNSLNQAKAAMEEAVMEAQRKVDDAAETLAQFEAAGASPEEVALAKKAWKRATEDRNAVQKAGERQVDSARDQLEFAGELMNRIDSGTTTGQLALKEALEDALKREEETLLAAKQNVEALEKALAKANQAVANGKKADANTALTQQQSIRLSALNQKLIQMDIENRNREIQKIEELIRLDGRVLAAEDGYLITQEINPGKAATGDELVELAVGTLMFEGTFDKERQMLSVGDRISVAIPGSTRSVETEITSINLLDTEEGSFYADLPELNVAIGAATSYQCQKHSDIYQQVIPIQGLRKDNKGYYVLITQARKSILGEEYYAVRKEVNLLYHGDADAAVEGSLLSDDQVIITSNQIIQEGDRVRVMAES